MDWSMSRWFDFGAPEPSDSSLPYPCSVPVRLSPPENSLFSSPLFFLLLQPDLFGFDELGGIAQTDRRVR